MFTSVLENLCIFICGIDIIVTLLLIWKTDALQTRLLIAAGGIAILFFRWNISLMIYQFFSAVLTLAGILICAVFVIALIFWMISLLFRW